MDFSTLEERNLVQRRVYRIFELRDRSVEKPGTDFRRQAHQNSKNKAVSQERPQHKEAAKFRGKQCERVGSIHRFHSSPNRRIDGFNEQAAVR